MTAGLKLVGRARRISAAGRAEGDALEHFEDIVVVVAGSPHSMLTIRVFERPSLELETV